MRLVGYGSLRFGLLAVALILVFVIACGSNSPESTEPASGNQESADQEVVPVRGMILEVVGRGLAELESLRIRDDSGKEWTFEAAPGFTGVNPSHLRVHQLGGESVLVTYEIQGSKLIALDVAD